MAELTGPVEVVGAGLLGTSVALACRRAGLDVLLTDVSADHLRTATQLGAGRVRRSADRPQLVVVATPPATLGDVIGRALTDSDAVVTDVGSVKSAPLRAVETMPEATRYVGSHPMAGNERSGPLAASDALFEGRPWAVTPHAGSDPAAIALVTELVRLCGGIPVSFTPADHDRAVARTSHVPHLMSALVAGRLAEAPAGHLDLSGQGVRDVTRVAGGDPGLYSQIVAGNAEAVTALLSEVRDQLDALIAAIDAGDRDRLTDVLDRGVAGTRAIPGKHGGPAVPMSSVYAAVPDEAGALARLFADVERSQVNVEDVRIDHDPGRAVGLVELVVASEQADHLLTSLAALGWVTHR